MFDTVIGTKMRKERIKTAHSTKKQVQKINETGIQKVPSKWILSLPICFSYPLSY
jgi:hypothetical protein